MSERAVVFCNVLCAMGLWLLGLKLILPLVMNRIEKIICRIIQEKTK